MAPKSLLSPLQLIVFFLLFSIILSIPSYAAYCPEVISKSLALEHDMVCPGDGPLIDGVGALIDCSSHKISGSKRGIGLRVSADRVEIKDCFIEGFQTGVASQGLSRVTVRNSVISRNEVGLSLASVMDGRVVNSAFAQNKRFGILANDSSLSLVQNQFSDNGKDVEDRSPISGSLSLDTPQEPARLESVSPPKPLPKDSGSQVVVWENLVVESALARLKIDPQLYRQVSSDIEIQKVARLDSDGLTIVSTISVKKPIDDLVLFEIIPKNLSPSATEISSDMQFDVLEYDPIIRFSIGSMAPGDQSRIEYRISRLSDLAAFVEPASVVIPYRPPVRDPPLINQVLFLLLLIVFGVWVFLVATSTSQSLSIHLVGVIIISALFCLGQFGLFFISSPSFHDLFAGSLISIAIAFYGVKAWLLHRAQTLA